jgi:hypothetical protein
MHTANHLGVFKMFAGTQSIVSIGAASAMIQYMPFRIHGAATELGIVPSVRINCVDHFSETDLQAIKDFLDKQNAKGGK